MYKLAAGLVLALSLSNVYFWYNLKDTEQDFEAYKLDAQLKGYQQKAANQALDKASRNTFLSLKESYQNELAKVKKFYEARRGSNSGATVNRVRKQAANNTGGMPKMENPAGLFTKSGADENTTLARDCAEVTLQYNALYSSWQKLCDLYGCD